MLDQSPGEGPLRFEVSGSYSPDPGVVIFRDAMFGGLLGVAAGGVIGLATDDNHVGRDVAIGAGAGILLGAMVGLVDVQAGPHISVRSDVLGGTSVGALHRF